MAVKMLGRSDTNNAAASDLDALLVLATNGDANAATALDSYPQTNGRTVASLAAYLANNAVFNVLDYSPPGVTINNGVTDVVASGAFQAAHDALPADGGVILVPPGTYLLDGTGATIANPIILLNVTKNNVRLVCSSGALFVMANWDQADAAGAGSDTAGANVFTVFRFTSGIVGGGVTGARFVGDSDGTALTVGEPRAKCVAVDGAAEIRIQDVAGRDIVGNVVNARGDTAGTGAAGQSRKVWVTECYAENCAESGFNFMGGTYDCVFSRNISIDNEFHGFESGTREALVCSDNICTGNQNGVSHVGRHAVISGNVCRDNRVSGINLDHNSASFDGAFNTVRGNLCYSNDLIGIQGDTDSHDNTIADNLVWDNGTGGAGEGIKLNTGAIRYTLRDNVIWDSGVAVQRYGLNIVVAVDPMITGNRTFGNSTWSLLIQGATANATIIGNDFAEALVSISVAATGTFVRVNLGFVTEANGTATVANGVTTAVVTHGLAATPDLQDISVTPTNDLGTAAKFWISTPTSTQFTINVDADPGAGTAAFVWTASIQ